MCLGGGRGPARQRAQGAGGSSGPAAPTPNTPQPCSRNGPVAGRPCHEASPLPGSKPSPSPMAPQCLPRAPCPRGPPVLPCLNIPSPMPAAAGAVAGPCFALLCHAGGCWCPPPAPVSGGWESPALAQPNGVSTTLRGSAHLNPWGGFGGANGCSAMSLRALEVTLLCLPPPHTPSLLCCCPPASPCLPPPRSLSLTPSSSLQPPRGRRVPCEAQALPPP